MADPTTIERGSARYSAAVRNILILCAGLITILPIPITYFKVLPVYREHGRFLVFYVPFLCLLTICYLFYVRDSLGRAMFADVLDPPPPPDLYYREPRGEWLRRKFRVVKGAILTVLPALLIFASMYCVSSYLGALNSSVSLASELYAARLGTESGALPSSVKKPYARAPATSKSRTRKPDPVVAVRESLPQTADTAAVRQYVLRTARIDGIPEVVELSGLYLAAFLTLLIAVALMALKEYAKEALGLSEHELVFGRHYRSGVNE